MSHTPGPWRAQKALNGETWFVWGPLDRGCAPKIAQCLALDREADALLIAAAPDLLEACEAVMEFLSNGTPVNPGALVQAEVFNAIAKAKGEA